MTQLNVLFLLKKLQDFFFFFNFVVQSLGHFRLFAIPWTIQNTRLPYPSLSPRVCLNSCPLSQWGHTTISSSAISFSSCPQSFLASGSFSVTWLFFSDLALCRRRPKYCSFSFTISPSNEYSELISFTIDWFDLLQSKGLRQEYWNGETFHFPGDLLGPGIESGSPALQADSLLFEPPRKPILSIKIPQISLLLIYLLLYNFISLCFNSKWPTEVNSL